MSKQPKKKTPPWADDDAVYKLVQAKLEENALEEERQFYLGRWDTYPDRPADEVTGEIEQQALDAWRRGNPNPLTDLLRPEHPLNRHGWFGRPFRDQLSSEAWSIICDRLLGKPLKRGRPKSTDDERRALNPVHDAADMVPAIERILWHHYPKQLTPHVKDYARAFAERLMGKDDPESAGSKVSNHINRSKRDRARLP